MLTCKGIDSRRIQVVKPKECKVFTGWISYAKPVGLSWPKSSWFYKNIFGIYDWLHLVHGSRRGSNLFWLLAKRIPPRSEKKKALAAKYVHISQLR